MTDSLSCPKCGKALDGAANFCPGCGEDVRGLHPSNETFGGAPLQLRVPAPDPRSGPSLVGELIDGRYRVLEKLGEGGMGSVYRVEHVRMGKVLALKLLRPHIAHDAALRERFHQEARVVSKLSHPNTVQVFDFGELPDASLYIAMEYLSGRDLGGTLRAHGPFNQEQATVIGMQVLASLAEAHEHGIVHRDVKPANVMRVNRRDSVLWVKLLDFGIAKLEQPGVERAMGALDLAGTPAYMAPEQARGDMLDARTDLYSVAAMLFELVTGRPVFVGDDGREVVKQHLNVAPPRPSSVAPPGTELSPDFEDVLLQALAKRPEDRFQSAERMQEVLGHMRKGHHTPVRHDFTPLPHEATGKLARREDFDHFERSFRLRRALAPAMALALLGGVGFAGWQLWGMRAALIPRTVPEGLEVEPNDQAAQATPLALSRPIEGAMGPPATAGRADRDVYLVNAPGQPLRIRLTGVEDLNLSLSLYEEDTSGGGAKLERRLLLDDGPAGAGEQLDGYVAEGPLYLAVDEGPHFTERPRGAREKSNVPYQLEVSTLSPLGVLEREPNDAPAQATTADYRRAFEGHTGEPVKYPPQPVERIRPEAPTLSGVDCFTVPSPPDGAVEVSALVVPHRGAQLWVVDEVALEQWLARPPKQARLRPPRPMGRSGQPERVSLRLGARGHTVRIQGATSTAPGTRYHLAFAHPGPDGLTGALALAELLAKDGRREEAQAVLTLALDVAPLAPQADAVRTSLAALSAAPRPP